MPTFGRIEPFSGKEEEFEIYIERVTIYFDANDLDKITLNADNSNADAVNKRNNKRRAILLSNIGTDTYTTLRNLLYPAKPMDKTFEDIVDALREHYKPKVSVSVLRYQFQHRIRQPGESVSQYVAQLRKLAEGCEFANLEDRLKDQIMCGINDENIQDKFMLEKEFDYKTAISVATAQEVAQRNVKILHEHNKGSASGSGNSASGGSGSTTPTVNKVSSKFNGSQRFKKGSAPSKPSSSFKTDKPEASRSSEHSKSSEHSSKYCYRCGDTTHLADRCRHIKTKCSYCKRIGHLSSVCLRLKNKRSSAKVNAVSDQEDSDPDFASFTDTLFEIKSDARKEDTKPIHVDLNVNGKCVSFQLDTGSSVSLMNHTDFVKNFGNIPLRKCDRVLGSYSGHTIRVVGELDMNVGLNGVFHNLPLVVVGGSGPPLLGRSWLSHIQLPWKRLFESTKDDAVNQVTLPENVCDEFKELFSDKLGLMKDFHAHFEVPVDTTPIFCKARPLPFAMKSKVQAELERLEKEGVIKKIVHSDWAAPVVPVVKPSGKIRLCGDYKLTINKAIQLDRYPLPLVDDIFTSLTGGKFFTKLDLSQAYHQIALDESSRPLTTVNTHCGLYQFLRLPYGASPCVGLFQRAMENLLKGLPGVSVFLDDILITGKDQREHLQNLRQVLTVLQENGLRLQKEKCRFMLKEVEYLGFKISADGIFPTPSKVESIKNAPAPTNISELRSVVGLVNYYARFLPNLAGKLAPIYKLLRKDSEWEWTREHQKAFDSVKELISHNTGLAHYDPSAELLLTTDASSVGVGAVLEIRTPEGVNCPRILTKPECHYAQIEREALGIIFGVQKFRQYLLGRRFTLRTDHRPLVTLFAENHGVPQLASARIKRWALILSAYSYDVQYVSTKDNGCADFLSRAPLPDVSEEVLHVDDFPTGLPITATVVAQNTLKDPTLSKVLHLTKEGWPSDMNRDDLQPYFTRRQELSIEKGCLLWGNRVIVPPILRHNLLLDLHMEHMGAARMKVRAKQYFWWPKLNEEIENITRQCISCQENAQLPKSATTAMWDWPSGPWKRLHIDYAGPVKGQMFLVVIDSHSKWLEVFPTTNATTETTISSLWKLFAVQGFPEHIVSDNGTQFTSFQFESFLAENGIKHTTSAPYHPATNGMAERYVGFIKKQLEKMTDDSPLDVKLSKILMAYRTTPHVATGEAPCTLLMKRSLRNKFSLLRPSLNSDKSSEVLENNLQCSQKFKVGDFVFALNLRSGAKWLSGVIIDSMHRNYYVQVGQQVWKRHEDQLRKRYCTPDVSPRERDIMPAASVPTASVPAGTSNYVPKAVARETVLNRSVLNDDTSSLPTNDSVNIPEVAKSTESPVRIPETAGATNAEVTTPRRYPARSNRGVKPTHFKDFVSDTK